jgi:hypothetical protein
MVRDPLTPFFPMTKYPPHFAHAQLVQYFTDRFLYVLFTVQRSSENCRFDHRTGRSLRWPLRVNARVRNMDARMADHLFFGMPNSTALGIIEMQMQPGQVISPRF